jgi:hypothetical protein
MSANSTELEDSQAQAERLQESQILKEPRITEEYLAQQGKHALDQLREIIAERDQTIAQLRNDCTYYEKVILALSRSKITAEQLAQWLREEPKEGMTFAEVVAELERPQRTS